MATVIGYCRGCNQRFTAADDELRCPQCGEPMSAGRASPTDELAETLTAPTPDASPDAEQFARALIGRCFDSYTIEAFVGKGGMAWVFRARHNTLERPCAIKVLSPALRRSQAFLDMFLAEARAAASVVHPHIVTVHNIGQADANHYIELEYVDGPSLQWIVRTEGPLDPLRATHFLRGACAALGEAHRRGLIHRDFKPSNILVGPRDFAKLADFGLAKRIASGRPRRAPDTLTGTPYFMAPELFEGEPASRQSDVYAVGVSYYYLLTGRFPFLDRSLVGLAEKHASEPVPDPRRACPELPDAVADLLNRCLAKRAADRPPDGQALCEALSAIARRLRDLRSLVAEALHELDVAWRAEGNRIAVTVRLPHGRSQRVDVEEVVAGPWQEELVKIASPCCPVDDSYLRRALELNATIAHGCLAIEEFEGQPFFVMTRAYPRATCDPEEIRSSVEDIAQWADRVEQLLTGRDVR